VEYISVIDRGRIVTVLNQDEAEVLFGLEMAIQKYGSRIASSNGSGWSQRLRRNTASLSNSRTRRCNTRRAHLSALQDCRWAPAQGHRLLLIVTDLTRSFRLHHEVKVLVQREMERGRSPLVSIQPCGPGFSRHQGLLEF
jgi:hypothetical protein